MRKISKKTPPTALAMANAGTCQDNSDRCPRRAAANGVGVVTAETPVIKYSKPPCQSTAVKMAGKANKSQGIAGHGRIERVIAQSAVAVFSQRHTGNGGGGGDKPRRRRRQTNADDNAAQYGATVIIAAGRPVAGKQTSFLAKERRRLWRCPSATALRTR